MNWLMYVRPHEAHHEDSGIIGLLLFAAVVVLVIRFVRKYTKRY